MSGYTKLVEEFQGVCRRHFASLASALAMLPIHSGFGSATDAQDASSGRILLFSAPGTHESPRDSELSPTLSREIAELLARSAIIYVSVLWEENFRIRIAACEGVAVQYVNSSIMDDVRLVRDYYVRAISGHFEDSLETQFFRIWSIGAGFGVAESMADEVARKIESLEVFVVHAANDA